MKIPLILLTLAVYAKAQTKCQIAALPPAIPIMGAPTIECEANGDYKPRQCNYSARTCYCVTTNGDLIPNTSWSLIPADMSFSGNSGPKDCVAERQKFAGGNNYFTTALPYFTNGSGPKVGGCPVPTGFGNCVSSCQRDSDCPGMQRCCSNGCGQSCQNPNFGLIVPTTPSTNPFSTGTCPDPQSVGGYCGNYCRQDSDCQSFGSLKCCSNGCGYTCVKPVNTPSPNPPNNPNDPCSGNPCPIGQTCTPIITNCFVPPCPSLYQCSGNNPGGNTTPSACRDPNSHLDQCNGNANCQETCNNLGQAIACPAMCVPGCACNNGYVWQSFPGQSSCVPRSQCQNNPNVPTGQTPLITQATATITGTATNPNVRGTLSFSQSNGSGPLLIVGTIQGLSAGSHGFHIHEFGDLGNNCISAGAHFNPANQLHNSPSDSIRHVGDLGNIVAPAGGYATIYLQDSQASLNGRNSIIGRAVVIHEKPDDLGKGGNDESRKTGNAGTRLACGVIGISKSA